MSRMKNENSASITGLEWDPRGRASDLLVFADRDGYVGIFNDVYPPAQFPAPPPPPPPVAPMAPSAEDDPLAEDSLLMEVSHCMV